MKTIPRLGALTLLGAILAGAASCADAGGSALASADSAPGANDDGWYPHEGGLLQYLVQIRFGEELEDKRPSNALPDGWKFGRVSSVATDSEGNVYVFHRGAHADPIVVFDAMGTRMLRSWGRGMFTNPHAIRVDPDDNVWITDNGDHRVMKFSNDGELLLELGTKDVAGTTPDLFNRPADIAFAPSGDLYVADGYGNARVVRFSKEGTYLGEWGSPGTGPGQFHLVHSLAIDSQGTVYVSDRENNRIQIFDAEGNYLREWNHLGTTQNIFITPADDMWIITHRNNIETLTYDTLAGRIMKIDVETGRILGSMESPGHWIDVAPNGNIFLGSLTGNVFRWYEGWLTEGAGETEGIVGG